MRLRFTPLAPPPAPAEPEPDLLTHIDTTARTLLRRIEGGDKMGILESTILTEQVKAFEAVVRWAGARKDLLPKTDEKKDARFAGIKSAFRQLPRSRGGAGRQTPSEDSPLPGEPAAAPDGDDGDED